MKDLEDLTKRPLDHSETRRLVDNIERIEFERKLREHARESWSKSSFLENLVTVLISVGALFIISRILGA